MGGGRLINQSSWLQWYLQRWVPCCFGDKNQTAIKLLLNNICVPVDRNYVAIIAWHVYTKFEYTRTNGKMYDGINGTVDNVDYVIDGQR